jgi:tetratricopeptide (TPR) repeat protein
MPRAREWLRAALHERFFPILESRFGVPENELTLHDALIIGYGYFGAGSRSQPVHRDSSLLSLNVALSPQTSFDANGGGTFFEGLPANESVIKTEQGHVLCHAGGAQHAGRGINGGERWILVLFCIAKNAPQLARRCHAKGIIERGRNDLQEAEAVFRAGLSIAPTDHLLLSSLGGVAMAKGFEAEAQNSLSAAALSYMHCQKANLGLGRMMLAGGKPRAALRRFQAVLEWMDNRDRMQGAWMPLRAMGWDARVYGAHSAIICVQEAQKIGANFPSSEHLKCAIDWLNVAREAAPEDPRILGALATAEELLSDNLDSKR